MSRLRVCTGLDSGASLIELLVVMTLMLVVMSIATSSVVLSMQTQRRQVDQLEDLAAVKLALERLTRELRGANPLELAEGGSARVRVTRGSIEKISTFALVPATGAPARLDVTEQVDDLASSAPVTTATRTLIRGVELPAGVALFSYRDAGGALLTGSPVTPAAVHSIAVRLRLAPEEGTSAIDISDRVLLRNSEAS